MTTVVQRQTGLCSGGDQTKNFDHGYQALINWATSLALYKNFNCSVGLHLTWLILGFSLTYIHGASVCILNVELFVSLYSGKIYYNILEISIV